MLSLPPTHVGATDGIGLEQVYLPPIFSLEVWYTRLNKSEFGEEIMLTLYEPNYEDLWFRQMMLADEDTMSYNHAWGGTIPWPEDKWSGWYDYWITCHEGKRYYRYLKNKDGQFVGEIAYHYDAEIQHEIANVMIYSKYRKNGYGSEALDLLCSMAKNNGISVLYDDIAIDNPAITLFLKHGFVEKYRTEEKIVLKKEL